MNPFLLKLLFFFIILASLGLVFLFYDKIRKYLNRRIIVSTKVYDMQQELRKTTEQEKPEESESKPDTLNKINEIIQTPIRFIYGFFQ